MVLEKVDTDLRAIVNASDTTAPPRNPKIPAVAFPSDDCMVYPDQRIVDGKIVDQGIGYAVHEGETVWVVPVRAVAEIALLVAMMGEGSEAKKGEALIALCARLAKRVTEWDWTDIFGEPLSQPHNNPAALEELSEDELAWIIRRVTNQETPVERGND